MADDNYPDTDAGGGSALPVHVGPQPLAIQTDIGGALQIRRAAKQMPRDLSHVKRTIRELAQWVEETGQFEADTWEYRFPVKNKRTGRTDWIEGPTVKAANAVARAWGNCSVDVTRVEENPGSYFLYATFIDYETGYQTTRVFRQRKSQRAMGDDPERAEDQIFQIGVSKAMRNVVANALGDVVQYALDMKRRRMVARVDEKPDEYRGRIKSRCDEIGYSLTSIEGWSGWGKIEKWPAATIAQVLQILAAHHEGTLANLDDVFAPGAKDVEGSASAAAARPVDPDSPKKDTKKDGDGKAPDKEPSKPAAATEPNKTSAPATDAAKDESKPDKPKASRTRKKSPAKAAAAETDKQPEPVIKVLGVAAATWDEAGTLVANALSKAAARNGMDDDEYNDLDRVIGEIARHGNADVAEALGQGLDEWSGEDPDESQQPQDGSNDTTEPDPDPGQDQGDQAPAGAGETLYRLNDGAGDNKGSFPVREYLERLTAMAEACEGNTGKIGALRMRNLTSLDNAVRDNSDDSAVMALATKCRDALQFPASKPRTSGHDMG